MKYPEERTDHRQKSSMKNTDSQSWNTSSLKLSSEVYVPHRKLPVQKMRGTLVSEVKDLERGKRDGTSPAVVENSI